MKIILNRSQWEIIGRKMGWKNSRYGEKFVPEQHITNLSGKKVKILNINKGENMKIKLSKNQWEMVGRKAGWMKTKTSGLVRTMFCNQCVNAFDTQDSKAQCPDCYGTDVRDATFEEIANLNDRTQITQSPTATPTATSPSYKNDPRKNLNPNNGVNPLQRNKPMPQLAKSKNLTKTSANATPQ